MEYFVKPGSIVRKIWGKSDTILLVFAGSAAEFSLNKSVDWLYFTGRLPSAPLERLLSTVNYARRIVFMPEAEAVKTIEGIASIHHGVEDSRKKKIPARAYKDVLYMLIWYSIRAHELLEAPLTAAEKEEVFDVFRRVGLGIGIRGIPSSYEKWLPVRESHLRDGLEKSPYTYDLYRRYRNNLGPVRYFLLIEAQKMLLPGYVRQLLGLGKFSLLSFIIRPYRFARSLKMERVIKSLLLPRSYRKEIMAFDNPAA